LLWGREITRGHLPSYDIATTHPVPHPLQTAVGTVAALAGSHALLLLSLVAMVALGALLWGTVRLAWTLAGPFAGVIAGALLAVSGYVVRIAAIEKIDVWFAALVVWGLVTWMPSPRRIGLWSPFLVAAGLLSPVGWAFSVWFAGRIVCARRRCVRWRRGSAHRSYGSLVTS
jgi:hypothetical protein